MVLSKENAYKFLNSLITPQTTVEDLTIIRFIKECVKEYFSTQEETSSEWKKYFEKLWSLYPRKVNKQLAVRTFEHKIRGLNEEECKSKCNSIYKAQMISQKSWELNKTDKQYIPHYSSWLNANVPNSKYYKGR